MPNANAKTTIDAVLCPSSYSPRDSKQERAAAFRDEFGPILGATRVYVRAMPGNIAMLTREDRDVTRYQPNDHPLAGQDRYEWEDRGDGVKYGLLIPEPASTAKDPQDLAAEALAKKVARRSELLADTHRTPAEDTELASLERWIAVLTPAQTTASRMEVSIHES